MKLKEILSIAGNSVQYLISFAQVEDILRVLGIILSVIISVLIIIDKVVTWWKNAHADGKITEDEIKEAVYILKEGAEEVKNHIEKETNAK